MDLVRTQSLTKIYGAGAQAVYALKDISVTIEEGEFVAIMGPSGSGKSTLLHLMGGLDRPSSGAVWLRGADLSKLGDKDLARMRRTSLGLVFQFFNLLPVLAARENVALPLILNGTGRADALRRADETLARVGLAARGVHRPSELSGGQQQRVAVARALVIEPALILADEPTGNLDSQSSDEIVGLLRRAVDEWGRTIVTVTHDARVAAHADRIIFLNDGQIVDENRLRGRGDAEQVRERLGKVMVS